MFDEIRIKNFKSVQDQTLKLNRINVFIGEPNSGKSNTLESIGLLSMIGHDPNILRRFCRFEKVVDIFHDQMTDKPVEIVVDEKTTSLELVNMRRLNVQTWSGVRIEYDLDGSFRDMSGKNEALDWYRSFKFYQYSQSTEMKGNVLDELTPPNGNNLPSLIYANNKVREILTNFLSEYDFDPVIDPYNNEIKVLKRTKNLKILLPYTSLSEGLKRMIFYNTIIHANRSSLITLEEPESYLFPYYVINLAESFGMTEQNKYLISTHNIYFLNSILEKTNKKDLNVYETTMDDGITRYRLIQDNEIGELLKGDPFLEIGNRNGG